MGRLGRQHRDKVQQFIAITASSEKVASQTLKTSDWHLEGALDIFYGQPQVKSYADTRRVEELYNRCKGGSPRYCYEEPHPSRAIFVQPLQASLPLADTTVIMTRSRLRATQEVAAPAAEARASPTRKRLRKGLLVSEHGNVSAVQPSSPGGPSTAVGLSLDSDDDNLPIATRVTRPKARRPILPDAEEEPVADAQDTEEDRTNLPIESEQVPFAMEVAEGDVTAEGIEDPKVPDPVGPVIIPDISVHSGYSSVGGENFVPKTHMEKRAANESFKVKSPRIEVAPGDSSHSTASPLARKTITSASPVVGGGEGATVIPSIKPSRFVQLAEVTVNLATAIATAAAGTSDPVASATSEQLADLYLTHFPEVPANLGESHDYFARMDSTSIPDLNAGSFHIDDIFSERQGGDGSFGLSREMSSPGHLPVAVHSNAATNAGQSSSGEVRRPQTSRRFVSLPPATQTGGAMAESPKSSARVSFLNYRVSAEVSDMLVRIQTLHPDTFADFNVPGLMVQTALLESFADFVRDLATKTVETTSNKFVEGVEANLSGFERNGLNLSWMRARLQVVNGLIEHTDNIAEIALLEKTIRHYESALEQHRQNLAQFKEKDFALTAQLPQDVGLTDSLTKGLI